MQKFLFYLPNALMIPEVYLMMSLIQNHLDKKKSQVTILTCGAGKGFACSTNIYGIKQICKACISRRNNSISKLQGNFKVLEIKKKFKYPKKFKKENILNLHFKNIDFGLGVYSSYTNTSRDTELRGLKSKEVIKNLLDTSYSYYKYFDKHFNDNMYRNIITFNSRMSEKRPLLRYAKINNINISNYEKLTTERFFDFKNNLSQDRLFLKKAISNYLKKNKKKSFTKENSFFKKKLYGIEDPLNPSVYSKEQIKDKLPNNWNFDKKNIVFFTASDDEHLAFGKDFNPTFSKNQKTLIEKTCQTIQARKNYSLWIRIHPNLKNVKWFDRKYYKKLELKYENVKVVYPEENVSSYAMLRGAYNIICLWSMLLVEATYWRMKKSISLTKNDFSEIGISIAPKNFSEYKKLIFQDSEENMKNRDLALKWVQFFLNAGSKIKYFSGTYETGYKFKNYSLNLDLVSRINYFLGKFKERIINFYFN